MVGIIPVSIAIPFGWRESRNGNLTVNRFCCTKKEMKKFCPKTRADLITGSVIFGTMLIGMWAIFHGYPGSKPDFNRRFPEGRGLSMMMLGMGGLTGGFYRVGLPMPSGPEIDDALLFGLYCIIFSDV